MNIYNFKSTLVEFSARKVSDIQVVWVGNELPDGIGAKELIDLSAVCIKSSPGFSELTFTDDKSVSMHAERYGGVGIQSNAGGVRCGNIKSIQVKGLGQNILVGDHDDFWHSNGSLPLNEAVREVVSSLVFQKILPIGVSKPYGLLRFNKPVAYNFSDMYKRHKNYVPTEPGALMAREICVRPAHFMVNPHYKPKHSKELDGENYRIRQVSRELYSSFEDKIGFIKFLGDFLKNCANQFAFAKINRIMHGAMSPSNISIDGRWLDLTNISTLPGRGNYSTAAVQKSFLEEENIVKPLVFELAYNVCKYEKIPFLNVDTLFSYFDSQIDAYHNYHFVKMLGLGDYLKPDSFSAASEITKAYLNIQRKAPKVDLSPHEQYFIDEEEISKCPEADDIIWFVLFLLKGVFGEASQVDNNKLNQLTGQSFLSLRKAFNNLISLAENESGITKESIVLSSLVKFLSEKLALHYAFPSLEKRCRYVIEKNCGQEINKFISDSENFIKKNYNASTGDEVNIFHFDGIKISYLVKDREFLLVNESERELFSDVHDLHDTIDCIDPIKFDVWGFSCKHRILSVLCCFSVVDKLAKSN